MRKITYLITGIMTFILITSGCSAGRAGIEPLAKDTVNESKTAIEAVGIDDLSKHFSTSESWGKEDGGFIKLSSNAGLMKSSTEDIAEAWYKYDKALPVDNDFIISAKVTVPKHWDNSGKKNGQVGVGIFVGKVGDGGKLVYECDLCTISKSERFVQGQMIKNRKGGEPVEVCWKTQDTESGIIEILYKAEEKTLSLIFNDEVIGTHKIDGTGAVNWNMTEDDSFIVGFMGFSEWVKIEKEYPRIEEVIIYS